MYILLSGTVIFLRPARFHDTKAHFRCVISGFHHCVNKTCALLGFYAAQIDTFLLMFRADLSASFQGSSSSLEKGADGMSRYVGKNLPLQNSADSCTFSTLTTSSKSRVCMTALVARQRGRLSSQRDTEPASVLSVQASLVSTTTRFAVNFEIYFLNPEHNLNLF